jgi:hypothetical protein
MFHFFPAMFRNVAETEEKVAQNKTGYLSSIFQTPVG